MLRIWLQSAPLYIFRQPNSWRHECTAAPLTSQMILITANAEAAEPASHYQHAKHNMVQPPNFLPTPTFVIYWCLTRPWAPETGVVKPNSPAWRSGPPISPLPATDTHLRISRERHTKYWLIFTAQLRLWRRMVCGWGGGGGGIVAWDLTAN